MLRKLDYGAANEPLYGRFWQLPINPDFWQPNPRAARLSRRAAPAPMLHRHGFLR
jgi:hypothetical protein